MTVSGYQIDNIIKAYHKQNKPRPQLNVSLTSSGHFADPVTLCSEDAQSAAYKKISYTMADILKNSKR